MKEIKFTTNYEQVLSFTDPDFKKKYERRVGINPKYLQEIDGDIKHLAVCPQCNNPVVILGIYKKINATPHARHMKGVDIPDIAQYNEYKYLRCPYHKKQADYIKEYVPETEEPQRQELYRIAKDHYDKAIYLLQKTTGIYITLEMAEILAKNYASLRVYNYIDATMYNIPWYLIYSFNGFPLYHMLVRKDSVLHRELKKIGIPLKDSRKEGYVYVEQNKGYVLIATNYRYRVDADENLREWLDFSILRPDDTEKSTLLFEAIGQFLIRVDSYYFSNLVHFEEWKPQQKLLDIAGKYMNP